MADGPVRFELVRPDDPRPEPEPTRSRSTNGALPRATHDEPYPQRRYPLVRPILETAAARRDIRGVCGECGTRLKANVRPPATLRCPVCGHEGRIGD